MKPILRYSILWALLCISTKKSNSQCTASDILIQHIVSVGAQVPGSCTATFDLSFTMQANNGNKFIFFHAWAPDLYPDYFGCVDGEPTAQGVIQAPVDNDLADAFINIGIDNSGSEPVLLLDYPASSGVTLNTADSVTVKTLSNGSYSFTIHGLLATLPGDCNGPIVIAADFWSSQAANALMAQCVSCNLRYALNFVRATGLAQCLNLTYFVNLINRTDSTLNGSYLVYADVNVDGVLTASLDSLIRDTTSFTVAAGVGVTTAINGTIPGINLNQNLLIHVILSSPAEGSSFFTIPSTQCAVLPVTFQSFTAVRTSATMIRLKWETVTEVNNNGFNIERNTGRDNWEVVAFIPTQAAGGNSNSLLTYSFDDLNGYKGTSQYRIRQTDINGNSRLSEIRLVKGDMGNSNMIVYPNPSSGDVNIQFSDENTRDIQLYDMNGRVIRKWTAVGQNQLRIENLRAGVYTLSVFVKGTGTVMTEKLVIY